MFRCMYELNMSSLDNLSDHFSNPIFNIFLNIVTTDKTNVFKDVPLAALMQHVISKVPTQVKCKYLKTALKVQHLSKCTQLHSITADLQCFRIQVQNRTLCIFNNLLSMFLLLTWNMAIQA